MSLLRILPLFFLALILNSSSYAANFTLTSKAFNDNQAIPSQYSCDGEELSPELNWNAAPDKTQAYALILSDPDAPAGTWYHWVAYNLPATLQEIPEGVNFPEGALAGKNSWGKAQYNGPCPPKPSTHHYIFTLYALDKKLELAPGADAETVMAAMQGHILAKATLQGLFGH